MRHLYCVPKWAESSQETLSNLDMLAKIESRMKIPYAKRVFENDDTHKEKLMALSVMYRLKLPQTSKSKQLSYSHLVLCNESDEPLIFYPQIRKTRKGRVEISITAYLTNLLGGQVRSLVEIPGLNSESIQNFNLLREGYVALAEETKSMQREWEPAEMAWPE